MVVKPALLQRKTCGHISMLCNKISRVICVIPTIKIHLRLHCLCCTHVVSSRKYMSSKLPSAAAVEHTHFPTTYNKAASSKRYTQLPSSCSMLLPAGSGHPNAPCSSIAHILCAVSDVARAHAAWVTKPLLRCYSSIS